MGSATRAQLHRAGLRALDFLVEGYDRPCRQGQMVDDGLGCLSWLVGVTDAGIEVKSADGPDFDEPKVYPWKTEAP